MYTVSGVFWFGYNFGNLMTMDVLISSSFLWYRLINRERFQG